MIALRGDNFLRQRQEGAPPSINDRVNNIEGDERFSLYKPSQTDLDDYKIAVEEFGSQLSQLQGLLTETAAIDKEMEKLGAPWTSGRIPEWDGN
jgi:hypothetical protein